MINKFITSCIILVSILSTTIQGQTATGNSKLAFDLPGQSVAIASTATYNGYVDGATTGVLLTGLTCSGTTLTTCLVNFPALTIGNHTITVTQLFGITESTKSSVLNFTFVVVVTPTNVRISGS